MVMIMVMVIVIVMVMVMIMVMVMVIVTVLVIGTVMVMMIAHHLQRLLLRHLLMHTPASVLFPQLLLHPFARIGIRLAAAVPRYEWWRLRLCAYVRWHSAAG